MKKAMKILSFIAMAAVIGLVFSCAEPDPDAVPVSISFTGLGGDYEGKYAKVILSPTAELKKYTASTRPTKVENGGFNKASIVDKNLKALGLREDKTTYYFVFIQISTTDNDNNGKEPTFSKSEFVAALTYQTKIGNSSWGISGGDNPFNLDGPTGKKRKAGEGDIGALPEDDFFGTYTATYSSNVVETVVFTKDSFKISDNTKTAPNLDHLNFTIERWDLAVVPSTQTSLASYTDAYKFTGVITGGNSGTDSGTNYVYGTQTAPGFTSSDFNTTKCHMYIYYKKNENGTISFERTTFSKETGTDVKTTVAGPRIFTK